MLTCFPSKLNQVFIILIANTYQAVEDKIQQTSESQKNTTEKHASGNLKFTGQVTISSEQ
ncbi:MAG: hypothetical protein HRT37_11160 [Alteromonadaceae bacterium]|nr:hypothetical protein [Alteromonadaceae bacterium]